MSLYPNILDPSCYSQTMQSPQPSHQQPHLTFHLPHHRDAHDQQPSFHRTTTSDYPQQEHHRRLSLKSAKPSHHDNPSPPSLEKRRLSLHIPDLSPAPLHFPKLSVAPVIPALATILTHIFEPNAVAHSSPTHDRYKDDCSQAGKTISCVNSVYVELDKAKQEEDDDADDEIEEIPLCREAEIAKWKTV